MTKLVPGSVLNKKRLRGVSYPYVGHAGGANRFCLTLPNWRQVSANINMPITGGGVMGKCHTAGDVNVMPAKGHCANAGTTSAVTGMVARFK